MHSLMFTFTSTDLRRGDMPDMSASSAVHLRTQKWKNYLAKLYHKRLQFCMGVLWSSHNV